MQSNAKRDWLCGQYDVHLFVPFFLPVHSAGSKLTVRCAWMSKSQGQTRELYFVLMRKGWMLQPSLDVLTKSRRMMSSSLCVRCAVANVGRRLEELAGVRTQW